jgi:transcriptional regulator with XRE-family HTH domain
LAVGSPPTVRRRQLGKELRRLREQTGMLAEALAERLRCSPSRISRIETARIRITPGTVHEILDVLGVEGTERTRLVTLARDADVQGWWQAYSDTLRFGYSTYIALESEATSLSVVEPTLVYGLLQTEEYARAIINQRRDAWTPEEVEKRVKARLARQRILTSEEPPHLHVVLDEAVLHHVIGDRSILRRQLRHLADAADWPRVTIQVLPFDRASVLTIFTGTVVMMRLPEADDNHVVYLESIAGDLYVEDPDRLRQYLTYFDRLSTDALGPDQSVKKIKYLASRRT